jgi:DNA-binding NarL/FixJ family response regulator
VEPRVAFTLMEKIVAFLVGRGIDYKEIAERLSVEKCTVKMHAENACAKLPGEDPPRMKLQIWFRGGDETILAPNRSER